MMLLDLEGRIQYINWTLPHLTLAEVLGTPVFNYVPERDRAIIRRAFDRILATGQHDHYVTEHVMEDGEVSQWESRVSPVVRAGRIAGFTVVSRNVTERRQAAADRDRFFSLSLDILAMADKEGHWTRVNPAFERALGYSEAELKTQPFIEFVHPDDREQTREAMRRLAAGEAVLDFENRYHAKDGSLRWISWRKIADPERQVVYGVGRDVTEQKALEQQLRHAQQMEAIGRLAGGLAHDFNNLLLAVQANAQLAERESDETKRRQYFEHVRIATRRGADLTRQLLMLSRPQPVHRVPLDLNQLTAELVKLMTRLLPENISIEFDAGPDLDPIEGDRSQIEQVILNLCLNARDALPNGGRLKIQTRNVLAVALDGALVATDATRRVRLSVSDTGVGMTPEVQARAFEPFFTTKEPGRGTGLGLATVYAIVQKHGGTINVESEPDAGTAFRLDFPRGSRSAPAGAQLSQGAVDGGCETLLVAEDEELVRNALVAILEGAGYRVLVAEDGEQAVERFIAHAGEVALAVLDVVMPRLAGPDAADRILALKPVLPVLFTTGYSDLEQTCRLDRTRALVLHKPYQSEDILRLVREQLGPPMGAIRAQKVAGTRDA
jgi:PAS domain S-box-containing protein